MPICLVASGTVVGHGPPLHPDPPSCCCCPPSPSPQFFFCSISSSPRRSSSSSSPALHTSPSPSPSAVLARYPRFHGAYCCKARCCPSRLNSRLLTSRAVALLSCSSPHLLPASAPWTLHAPHGTLHCASSLCFRRYPEQALDTLSPSNPQHFAPRSCPLINALRAQPNPVILSISLISVVPLDAISRPSPL